MSIKIHNGYRLRLNGTPESVFARNARTQMVPLLRLSLLHMVAVSAVNTFHRRQLAKAELLPEQSNLDASPWWVALRANDDSSMDTHFQEMNDFSFMLYTDPQDENHEWTYLTTYGGSTWEKVFVALISKTYPLERYGYWNNSDMPDGVTSAEWTERRELWKRIGILDRFPVECGVEVSMVGESWHAAEAMSPLWGHEDAARQAFDTLVAKDGFLSSAARKLAPDVDGYQNFTGENKVTAHNVIRFIMDETRDGIRKELAQKIEGIITVPTWGDLLKND